MSKRLWYPAVLGLVSGALSLGSAGPDEQLRFERGPELDFQHVSGTPAKAYILEATGSGVALFDYDSDGDLDVYLVNASTMARLAAGSPGESNRLFRNEGEWRFTDVTMAAGVGHRGFGQGVAVADINNDGNQDLYVTNYGLNVLYRNNGDGTFAEVAGEVEHSGWSTSAAFGDVDGDGFVDLYVCNYLAFDWERFDRENPGRLCDWMGLSVYCGPEGFAHQSGVLYHNQGDGTFEDWTEKAGVADVGTYQLGALFADFDQDGDPDLYVAADATRNLLFENKGGGRFDNISDDSGAALSQFGNAQAGMGVDAGDVNGDGWSDIFVTNFSNDSNTLYLNLGGMSFVDMTDVAGLTVPSLPFLGWSTRLADLDADGDLDIFLVNGHVYPQADALQGEESFQQPMQLFLNRGDGTFVDFTFAAGSVVTEPRSARGAALGDLDGDRDQDIVVNILDGSPVLLNNQLSPGASVVMLRLIGRKANRDGVGARVGMVLGEESRIHEVRGDNGYLSHSDSRLYLGLGGAAQIDTLTILWPGGGQEVLSDVKPGSYVVLEAAGLLKVMQ